MKSPVFNELQTENFRLKRALKMLMLERNRDDRTCVYINYTLRGQVRGILGRALARKVGL